MNTQVSERPIFELDDPLLSGTEADLFGPWTIAKIDEEEAFDLSEAGAGAAEGQAWRVNLPSDPALVLGQFTVGETRLEATAQALNDMPDKLDAFVDMYTSFRQVDDELAFGEQMARPALGPAEESLWDELRALEKGETIDEDDEISFDMRLAGIDLGEKVAQAEALIEHIQQWLQQFARVETRQGSELFGYTIVGWLGDFRTAWLVEASAGQKRMHTRSLSMALAWRHQLMRTFILTVQTLIKLWAAVSMPILALPIIWSYINKILKERERTRL